MTEQEGCLSIFPSNTRAQATLFELFTTTAWARVIAADLTLMRGHKQGPDFFIHQGILFPRVMQLDSKANILMRINANPEPCFSFMDVFALLAVAMQAGSSEGI